MVTSPGDRLFRSSFTHSAVESLPHLRFIAMQSDTKEGGMEDRQAFNLPTWDEKGAAANHH